MKLTCLNCGHEFDGDVSHDSLGWHSSCPECGGSFDTDAPGINPAILDAQRRRFYQLGIGYLDQARDFLHNNCDNWSSTYEDHYQELIRKAEAACTRFSVLCDLLRDGRIIH